jgi:tetratricopeptide (TPR) repeat protein
MRAGGMVAVVVVVTALAGRAAAQGGAFVPAKCDLKAGHFKVNSGFLYLRSAAGRRFEEDKQKDLRDANRNLLEAIQTGGQEQNPAAWYWLARYYVEVKDAVGADSAFTRAERLKPDCKEDIATWRFNMWVPMYNAAVTLFNAGNTDSTIKVLSRANAIYRGQPQGLRLIGVLYYNGGQYDSAAKYFREAIDASSDPKFASDKKETTFNLAAALFNAHRYDEAVATYRQYLAIAPGDPQALAALAEVFSATGHEDSAVAMYHVILDHADSADAISLFHAGERIYNSAPQLPDTAAQGASCRADLRRSRRTLTVRAIAVKCDSVTRAAVRQRDAEAAETYRLAGRAFEIGLKKNPMYRDGLFNLATVYFVLRDSANMLPVAQRLYALDPLNRQTLRLMAQAWQFRHRGDSTLYYLTADSLLPVEVSIEQFSPEEQNATIQARVSNFHAQPSLPLKLVFDCLNDKGDVVATTSVDVPSIPANGDQPVKVQAAGKGIAAWRYKKG